MSAVERRARAWPWAGTVSRPRTRAALGLALAMLLGVAGALGQERPIALRAEKWVGPDGGLHDDGLVVIQDGRIQQVGGEAPADARVLAFEGVLSPGLVDAYGSLGARGELAELASAVEPDAQARDALDRYRNNVDKALAAGVTTFTVTPNDENLVGGQVAICAPGVADGWPEVLDAEGVLKLSLSSEAYKGDREPTSRAGAVALLRRTLAQAAKPDARGPLAELMAGQRRAVLSAPTAPDVIAGLRMIDEHELPAALVHQHDAQAVAPLLAAAKVAVVVGPYDLYSSRRDARAAGVFEDAGVEVVLAGGLPQAPADSLRLGAAIAVREGLSPEAARRAITSAAAEMLGTGQELGSLAPGRRADVVVFSGDPLDLRSRVVAVFVGGQVALSRTVLERAPRAAVAAR